MMIFKRTVFFSSFLLLISICFHVGKSDNHLAVSCLADEVYNVSSTSGREYRNSLESLFSVLSSNASQPNGFYNFTSRSSSATTYGLFLCRGDVTPNNCKTCVTNATLQIFQLCPNATGAVIWYDNCMLRYSNQYFFSQVNVRDTWYLSNTRNVSDTALLDKVLGETLGQIATRAANDVSGKKFAVQQANFTPFANIYTLAQCTPDLSNLDCDNCLRNAILNLPRCCANRLGGRVLSPSCNVRYETTPFYEALPVSGSPPASLDSDHTGELPSTTIVAIVIPSIIVLVSVLVIMVFFCKSMRAKKKSTSKDFVGDITGVSSISTDAESLRYNFIQVQACTCNFAIENKIGQGGFGSVFKGTLPNGQLVAVKRLSSSSSQGGVEFINEIALVAKLQHRNLVRLLDYCLEGEEKILVYEFVTNKSLDYFLFDLEKQHLLDWSARYKIIGGIARGLLYLHEDSRIRIIHRDLKAGNVLLDENINPKIADFGLARLFEMDQSKGNTSKVAGTFGYMAPEYAYHGMLSVKSDVFSFGVLLLEIISGKKNSDSDCFDDDDLLTYAWKQWRDGTPLSVMDPETGELYDGNEVVRCIHIGLLCVSEDAECRPNMASVVLMLNSYSFPLPAPNPPAYFGHSRTKSLPRRISYVTDSDKSSSHPKSSKSEASTTEICPR